MRARSSFVYLADRFLIFLFRAEKTEVLSEDLLQVRLPAQLMGTAAVLPVRPGHPQCRVTVSAPMQVCGETLYHLQQSLAF